MKVFYQDKWATIYEGDNMDVLPLLASDLIDLTVTSPPYDNLRTYQGYEFDFEGLAKQLYRVTKPGGVVVWVVADATIDGSETGTSFRQALYFKDQCGFNLHDTMIFQSNKPPMNDNRYQACFEYMFVLSKGKPKTFNPITERCIKAGISGQTKGHRSRDGIIKLRSGTQTTLAEKPKISIWNIYAGSGHDDAIAYEHPARFPEQLANDHIRSWSNPGDLILDPFCGSGTTAKMARKNGCKFIGIDVSRDYCEIAAKRLAQEVFEFTA